MTTIAYDGKSIAADSQGTCGFIEQSPFTKIFEVDDYYIAGSGSYSTILAIVDWFRNGRPQGQIPEFDKDSLSGLFVVDKETKMLEVYGAKTLKFPTTSFSNAPNALGSGEEFAMGALLSGASASQAVLVACRLDPKFWR